MPGGQDATDHWLGTPALDGDLQRRWDGLSVEMKHIADKPGFYQGKHATEYVEQVQALKRVKQFAEAKRLLLALIQVVEAENLAECWGVAPWYYEQLANIYHGQKNYAAEIAILERYQQQPYRKRVFPFANRLVKARELLREITP